MITSNVRIEVLLSSCLLVLANYASLIDTAPLGYAHGAVQILVRPRGNSGIIRDGDPTVALDIPQISELDAAEFLLELGFGDVPVEGPSNLDSSLDTMSDRIRAFQRFSGLRDTGELDNETKLLMATPRCGVRIKSEQMRYGGSLKWNKRFLTYRIENFPGGRSPEVIRSLVRKAFHEWSNVTNLDFTEVRHSDRVDIRLSFGGLHHSSRAGTCSFEIPQTLAHAFFPPIAEVHFNTRYYFEANWSLDTFLNTAVHEIGHVLGLPHMNSLASLMHPLAANGFIKPQPMDVQAIQMLYGARPTTDSTTNNDPPKFCSLPNIDAAIQESDGSVHIFAGDYFYDPIHRTGRLISSRWPGLPGDIDAAFFYGSKWTFFFRGSKVWCFEGTRLAPGYPRLIGEAFPGLPDNIDATLVDGSGNLHVFRDDQFWVYDSKSKQVVKGMPASVWKINLPTTGFDAGLNTKDQLMLFKGVEFYRWDGDGRTVRTYFNDWFLC